METDGGLDYLVTVNYKVGKYLRYIRKEDMPIIWAITMSKMEELNEIHNCLLYPRYAQGLIINIWNVWYCQIFHDAHGKCDIPLKYLSEDIKYAVEFEVSSLEDWQDWNKYMPDKYRVAHSYNSIPQKM